MNDLELLNRIALGLAAVTMVIAAINDARKYRIPNLACLALIVLFPFWGLTAPTPIPWLEHLVVFALTLFVGYGLYARKWAGAGDIKLLAAISLWAGPAFWGVFFFVTATTGGLLSLVIGIVTLVRLRLAGSKDKTTLRKTPIPYGVAIAVGGLCTLALLSHPDLLPGV